MKLQAFRKFLWLCLLWVSIAGYAQEAPETWMPDANLHMAIREKLGLSDEVPLTKGNIKRLIHLEAQRKEIRSVQGLEFAQNLEVGLNLEGNLIEDITPLRSLTKLRGLVLLGNQVFDLSPLESLTSLVYLNCAHNPINDLSVLSNLIHLEELDLKGCQISDVTPLAELKNLKTLILSSNLITDVSPLANLTQLERLEIQENPTSDFSTLQHLNLTLFEYYNEFCNVPPFPIENRVALRSFPSIFQAWDLLIDDSIIKTVEGIAYHDLYWPAFFELDDFLTPEAPTHGLATKLVGDIELAKALRQELVNLNPNILFFVSLPWSYSNLAALPDDSDVWARDVEGNKIKIGGPFNEYAWNILKPEVQNLIIEKAVGLSECGLYDGILFDGFINNGITYTRHAFPKVTDEEMLTAVTGILRGIRERVHENFLIVVNANQTKPDQYTEYVNGTFMETGQDDSGRYTYKGLEEIEDTLLWAEEHLREPQINCLEGWGIGTEPPDSPENQQWMRVFTTMGLTHSDGYVLYNTGRWIFGAPHHEHIWYDFWDADLGRPVGGTETKGQLYESREGLFIREFTNGWAVYNRSGKPQDIQLPEKVSGWASGVKNKRWHTIPDLDGEIYLKTAEVSNLADVNEDGVINVLDMVLVARHFGESVPPNSEIDINADGIVNILDLILVSQHMGESIASAAPSMLSVDDIDGLDPAMIQAWIERAQVEDDSSIAFQQGIANLQRLLASLIPEKTMLLENYPNPFNPETWIPYHLANPSDVRITIYNTYGSIVRRLDLGHQREGYYTDRSRAAYWDGRNALGERVASGVYFYQLQADHLSLLCKMVILK